MGADESGAGRSATGLLDLRPRRDAPRSSAARARRDIELTRLALAARDGDPAAFDALVQATRADLQRFCVVLSDARSADDLAQETYLRAVTAIHRYRGDASPITWLCSIARRIRIDVLRRQTRHGRIAPRYVDRLSEIAADCSGEVELRVLLASIDPDRRAAFELTQVLGFRYQDAAALLACPVGTVRSRVARARADLLVAVITDH